MSKKLIIPGLDINKYQWLDAVMESNVNGGAKLRAYSIYSFTDDRGFAWPNQWDIEKRIGSKSISRTSQYVNQLQQAGWIAIEKQQIDAMRFSNNYRLSLPYTRKAGY